jgi:hypothetical protein
MITLSAVATTTLAGGSGGIIGNVADSVTTGFSGTFGAVGDTLSSLIGIVINAFMGNMIQGLS